MTTTAKIEEMIDREYEHGFYTDIEADTIAVGLNEDAFDYSMLSLDG